MSEAVLYETRGPAAWITLNRPEKLNAINKAVLAGVHEAIDRATADDEVKVVVVTGAGRAFSAGYDLAGGTGPMESPYVNEMTGRPDIGSSRPGPYEWAAHVTDFNWVLWNLYKPIIAQVHGYCLAGGTELATACDLVYVAHDAQIGYPPVRSMSSPDMAWHVWLMGLRRAMEAMLTGDSMTGDEAVEAGFANRAFDATELDERVLEIAQRVAKVSPDLQALNKRVVHRAMEAMGMRDGMRATTDINALGFHQRASREYFARLRESVTTALDERDGTFGDYRTAER